MSFKMSWTLVFFFISAFWNASVVSQEYDDDSSTFGNFPRDNNNDFGSPAGGGSSFDRYPYRNGNRYSSSNNNNNEYDNSLSGQQGLVIQFSARTFFNTCLAIRDLNKFYANPEEALPPPVAPVAILDDVHNNSVVPDFVAEGQRCTDFQCVAQDLKRDPRQLEKLHCQENTDCEPRISGMYCRQFRRSDKFCDCPRGMAYNAITCQCQLAERCLNKADFCHNGMRCSDHRCSCTELTKQLYDPHSRLCVEKSASNWQVYTSDNQGGYISGGTERALPEVVAVAVLAAIVIIVVIGLSVYLCHQHANGLLFQRGDYRCEGSDEPDKRGRRAAPQGRNNNASGGPKPSQPKKQISVGRLNVTVPRAPAAVRNINIRRPQLQQQQAQRQYAPAEPQVHVAAWDLPSLDHLDDEQAGKYMHRSPQDSKKLPSGDDSPIGTTGATTASTVEAADIAAVSAAISSSRLSLQVSPTETEGVRPTRVGRHSRTSSVDLRFDPKIELEPNGGARGYDRDRDSVTMSSDIL